MVFWKKKEIVVSHFCCNFQKRHKYSFTRRHHHIQCMIHFTCRVLFFSFINSTEGWCLGANRIRCDCKRQKFGNAQDNVCYFSILPLLWTCAFKTKQRLDPFLTKREKTCVFSLIIICWSPKHQTIIIEGVRHPILYSCGPFIL